MNDTKTLHESILDEIDHAVMESDESVLFSMVDSVDKILTIVQESNYLLDEDDFSVVYQEETTEPPSEASPEAKSEENKENKDDIVKADPEKAKTATAEAAKKASAEPEKKEQSTLVKVLMLPINLIKLLIKKIGEFFKSDTVQSFTNPDYQKKVKEATSDERGFVAELFNSEDGSFPTGAVVIGGVTITAGTVLAKLIIDAVKKHKDKFRGTALEGYRFELNKDGDGVTSDINFDGILDYITKLKTAIANTDLKAAIKSFGEIENIDLKLDKVAPKTYDQVTDFITQYSNNMIGDNGLIKALEKKDTELEGKLQTAKEQNADEDTINAYKTLTEHLKKAIVKVSTISKLYEDFANKFKDFTDAVDDTKQVVKENKDKADVKEGEENTTESAPDEADNSKFDIDNGSGPYNPVETKPDDFDANPSKYFKRVKNGVMVQGEPGDTFESNEWYTKASNFKEHQGNVEESTDTSEEPVDKGTSEESAATPEQEPVSTPEETPVSEDEDEETGEWKKYEGEDIPEGTVAQPSKQKITPTSKLTDDQVLNMMRNSLWPNAKINDKGMIAADGKNYNTNVINLSKNNKWRFKDLNKNEFKSNGKSRLVRQNDGTWVFEYFEYYGDGNFVQESVDPSIAAWYTK